MKQGRPGWLRHLRRGCALFLATITVWLLSLSVDVGAAAAVFRSLAESPAFVAAALRAELGEVAEEADPMAGLTELEKLALRRSPALTAGLLPSEPVPELTPELAPIPEEDPEDPEEITPPPAREDIVARTLLPSAGTTYASAGGVYIENTLGQELDVAALAAARLELSLAAGSPQILIMHTHGSEAYAPDGEDVYTPSDYSRTTDPNYNVVRVGEEIAGVLREMGLEVLHDTTLYDYPEYNGAYERSRGGIQNCLAEHPTIQVVLDVHRDAIVGEDGTVCKPLAAIGGEDCAQVMLVMGTDLKYSHPYWRENLSLAVKLQRTMNTLWPGLARPIGLRAGSYNQQLTRGSVLVEVGSHGNTLQEALAGARMFARSAGAVLAEYLEGP